MSTRRLVLFCSVYPSKKGETFLHNEIPFLLEKFDELVVFTESTEQESLHDRIKIIPLNRGFRFNASPLFWLELIKELIKRKSYNLDKVKVAISNLLMAFNVLNQLREAEAERIISFNDVFYTYWINESTVALALLKKKNSELNFYSRVHGWDLYEERHTPMYLPFRPFILSMINKVFSISENGKSYLTRKHGETSNVQVSRLGVSEGKERVIDKTDSEEFTIVSCSSVIPLKRVELIFDFVNSLPFNNVKWIHFGDGELMEQLENKVLNNKKETVSVDLKGYVSNERIRCFYFENKVDLFVNLSTTEGIPVSIMEAFSYGIPALATNVGAVSEIVVDGVNGVMVNRDDSLEIILKKFTSSFSADLSKSAWEMCDKRYNEKVNYKLFSEDLQK